MAFNMDDYVDVAERIRLVKEQYPEAVFRPADPTQPFKIIEVAGALFVAYTAALYRDPFDSCPAIACAWEEIPGRTPYTKGSELMNAETSAWGRCAIALGIPSKKIASAQEIKARQIETSATVTAIKKTDQELHDPWATTITEVAPEPIFDAWHCKHGPRKELTGTKNGKDYMGMMCDFHSNTEQCKPNWFSLGADGNWAPRLGSVK